MAPRGLKPTFGRKLKSDSRLKIDHEGQKSIFGKSRKLNFSTKVSNRFLPG